MKKITYIKNTTTQLIFLIGLINSAFAQTNLTYFLDETGSSVVHTASQEIKFLPGYIYTPDAIRTHHSYINTSNSFNQTYSGLPEDNFIDREINTGLPVGSIAGQHQVDLFGAATYTIPITLPVGTNGFMPTLALSYNSMGQSNVLGMGWGVAGISRISKKSLSAYYAQFYIDEVTPINKSIAYELDGKHLQLSSSQLKFEENDYNKIYQVSGGFTLKTKEGLTYYYGTSSNSKQDGLFWYVDKIEDNNGNYIEYVYGSENLIAEIRYTGNAIQGLAPFNKVKFTYKNREDINRYYYYANNVGQQVDNNKLLEKIEVFADNQPVKKFRFNYSFALYSYLYEIIESGADDNDLNSTIINYKSIEKIEDTNTTGIPSQNAEYRTGDFNGDGKTDFLAIAFDWIPNPNGTGNVKTYTHYKVYLNQGGGNFTLNPNNGSLPTGFYPYDPKIGNSQSSLQNAGIDAVDLNGDGLEDMVLGVYSAGLYGYIPYYANLDPSGNVTFIKGAIVNTLAHNLSDHDFVLGDFNGDGKMDAFVNRKLDNLWKLVFFSGSSASNNEDVQKGDYINLSNQTRTWNDFSSIAAIDYDGDGKSEILCYKSGYELGYRVFSFDVKVHSPSWGSSKMAEKYRNLNTPSLTNQTYFGDFNGDGNTDILSLNQVYGNNRIYFCTSNGFNEMPFSSFSGLSGFWGGTVVVSDFNGDGKADIYVLPNINTLPSDPYKYYIIYYSNGLNFIPQTYLVNQSIYFERPTVGDFDGNGSIDVAYRTTQDFFLSFTDPKKKLAKTIKNGFNNEVSFNYAPLTNGLGTTVYEKYSGAVYPNNDAQFPIHVVSSVTNSDGIGGTNTTSYFYKGAIFNRTGKGFLGFSEVSSTNNNLKLKTTIEFELFHEIIPFLYTMYRTAGFMVKNQKKYLSTNNTLLESTTYTNQVNGNFNFVREVTQSIVHDYLTDVITTTDFTYDTGGNPETITTSKNNNVETSLTTNVFQSIANWGPKNKLTSTTTTVTRPPQPSYTRSVNFTYDATKGSLETKTEDNGLLTTYEHTNGLGNITKSTLSGGGITTKSTQFIYDAKGRFVEETINPLNQHSFATYDSRWGTPLTQTGVDGLTTTYQYNQFGRLTTATTPDNITTTSDLAWEIGGGTATNPLTADNSIYTVTTATDGSPTQKTWYDSFGRSRKNTVDGFENKINQVTTYDNRGNVATTTTPFFATDEPLVTTYTYNDLNLANTIVSEIGTTSFAYVYNTADHIVTTTQTLPDGNSSTSVTDATGKLIKAIDNGGTLDYTYYSSGLQKDIKLNTVLAASMEYNQYGKQTKLIDPNAGTTDYTYDAIGQLTYQKDAKNNEYTMTYDALGRLATKTENGTSFGFTYYTNGNGINQPENITYNGINQHFTYDYLNRLTETKETFEGEDYIFGYQYDNFNRVEQTTYPSGFITKHHYNSFGYPTTVTDEQATATYWQAGSMNAYNQYKTYTLGNLQTTTKTYDDFGLPTSISTTNPTIQNLVLNFNPQNGNLMSRANPNKNLLEEFTYDNLNRLEETKINGVPQQNMQYQGNGNIGFKTDAGNYTYDVNRKNAVTQVSNQQVNISTNLQEIEYTPFNSVNTIIENPLVSGQVHELTFTYGADQQRRKMEHKVGGTVQKTTYYFGNYEKIKLANGDQTELHYIGGGDGLSAIYVVNIPLSGGAGVGNVYYTYTDHLGSITTLTDQNATIVYEQNFDAWGRERNPDTWEYTNTTAMGSVAGFEWLTRGYTGHEHLAEFGLINMNGRLYDPILARMLSPDNYVQDATSTQGYNRYSYVINNPLKYTDPSGEFWNLVIGAAIGGTINWLTNGAKFDSEGLKYFGVGAAAGALGAGIGAGISSAMAGGSFGAGFVGSTAAKTAITSFASGATIGGGAGFSSGFTAGFGNSLINGDNFKQALGSGFKTGVIAGLSGAALGGALSGLNAHNNGRDFWNGDPKFNTPKDFYVDKSGVQTSVKQIEKYRRWAANGRKLTDGQQNALARININSVDGSYSVGDVVNESSNIYLGENVNTASLTANGSPAFDLTTRVNLGGQIQNYNLNGMPFSNPFQVSNASNLFFNTSGIFLNPVPSGSFAPQVFFNLIIYK